MENNESQITPTNYRQLHPDSIYKPKNDYCRYKNEVKSQTAGKSELKATTSGTTSKHQKRVADTTNIFKSFLAIVSTIIVAVVGVSSITTNVKAHLDWLEVSETAVYYSLYLTDYDEGSTCYVTLHNDFVDRREEITDNSIQGYFDNLQPNMYYTLSVKADGKVILERTIYTRLHRSSDSDYPEYEKPYISDDMDNDEDEIDYDNPSGDYGG